MESVALTAGMAGSRCPPDEPPASSAFDAPSLLHYSDDERSVAADSWSVKSEYGSTLDGDDQRNADVVDALNASSFRPSDYTSDKEEQDAEVEPSVLGLQSHWDSTYADELVNFHEQGDNGEIWFGEEVMETMAAWTARVCIAVAAGMPCSNVDGFSLGTRGLVDISAGGSMALELANWNVLDLGTGNGLLLHALAKQGFTNLTGTDYSEAGVELAQAISMRSNVDNVTFLVDDVLDTKLTQQFKLVTDKGTLDAIGLHPDGPARRIQYWKTVSKLLAPGGVLVITSCNSTKDELVAEVDRFNRSVKSNGCSGRDNKEANGPCLDATEPTLEYIDHIRTYPTFRYGGVEGSRVSTVSFILKD